MNAGGTGRTAGGAAGGTARGTRDRSDESGILDSTLGGRGRRYAYGGPSSSIFTFALDIWITGAPDPLATYARTFPCLGQFTPPPLFTPGDLRLCTCVWVCEYVGMVLVCGDGNWVGI